jgi:uncharacterized membrane protein
MNTTSTRAGSATIWNLLNNPTIQAALGVLIVLTVSAIAFHLLSKLRGSNNQDHSTADLLQKNFEEMRSGGDISEAEFRRISASLGQPASTPKQRPNDGNHT